jgi:chromosome segregation ATPase
MSVPRHTVQDHPDLESTAELPVLDTAALEATQDQIDTAAMTAASASPAAPPELRPVEAAPSASGPYRGRLEEDLKSLSASLREFEERLAVQGARSTALESELKVLREAHSAAERRATGLSGELAEGRSALVAAEAQINELMQLLEQRESTLRSSETRSAALETQRAERERSLATVELQLRETRLQASAQLEALQVLEARRGVLDSVLDDSLAGRDEELIDLRRANEKLRQSVHTLTENGAASLERAKAAELAARARAEALTLELAAAVARQRELEAALAVERRQLQAAEGVRQERTAALESEVAELRSQLAERTSVLTQVEARHAEQIARLGSHAGRVHELEAQVADYAKAMLALQEEFAETRERRQAAEGDVRAAEEALLRLEGEIRAKSARIEELTKLNDDWRGTLEAARQSIAERDALIRRLETEAAHGAALLDNIQHSIRSLESSPGVANEATSGQGATRLLVRTEGETEVVHVLGRKTSIGRTPDNDVQIDTKFVSRHHAVILSGNVHTIIEDLNSTNGVVVNGQRVTRHSLKDGDSVVVGNAQFRFAVRPARNASEQ